MRVGVEVGGTFTDLVAIEDGRVRIAKVPSVPARPEEGVFHALEAGGIALSGVDDLVHGSTVATNAILERKGGRVALLATLGFRDVLFLQRQSRRRIYELAYRKPVPVVAPADIFEVPERIAADGSVVRALDEEAVARELTQWLKQRRVDSLAVCLLNSYANPDHEAALGRIVEARFPELTVALSSDVTREFREYERASTTTLAAYVQSVISRYLGSMERHLSERQFRGRLSIMQSNGGRLPPEGVRHNPIAMLFSGPAAGVIGAVKRAALAGQTNLISFDMGGTSTDVCLVRDGRPEIAEETEIDGLPVRVPVLDIVSIGAGGGSNVWVDDGGMLRVGPMSSGADPGPACYGRGGEAPTITDAHVVRGSIRPEAFLGGRMALDVAAAQRAFEPLAARVGLSVEALASAALRVATSNIVRAIQMVSTERGRDPRDYVPVPFGGAGPLHAAEVAAELGMTSLVVPPNAGVLSDYGLLAADYVRFATETRRMPLKESTPDAVRSIFAGLRAREQEAFAALGVERPLEFRYTLALRYRGQAFEVPVELDAPALEALTTAEVTRRFEAAHRQVFRHGDSTSRPVELVSLRLCATAALASAADYAESGELAFAPREVEVSDGEVRRRYRAMARASLKSGERVAGPALIEDATSTVHLPAGWAAEVDAHHNLLISQGARG